MAVVEVVMVKGDGTGVLELEMANLKPPDEFNSTFDSSVVVAVMVGGACDRMVDGGCDGVGTGTMLEKVDVDGGAIGFEAVADAKEIFMS